MPGRRSQLSTVDQPADQTSDSTPIGSPLRTVLSACAVEHGLSAKVTAAAFQPMPPLAEAELAALRADITERGVLVPVVVDQHGRLLDGGLAPSGSRGSTS